MKVFEHYPGVRSGPIAIALALCLAMTQVAAAATVQYSTTGTFAGPGANGNKLSGIGPGTSTLTFNGTSQSVDVSPPLTSSIYLGKFSLTASGWGGDVYFGLGNIGQSFKLSLQQTTPVPGGGSATTLALLGAVKKAAGGVLLAFGDTTFQIGNIIYTVDDAVFVPVGSAVFMGTLTARQAPREVNVVPLPAAAWGGMALMGLIGAIRLRRRAAHVS